MTQVMDNQISNFDNFDNFDNFYNFDNFDNINTINWDDLKNPIRANIYSPIKIPFLDIRCDDKEWNICPIGKDIITYPCRTYEKGHHFEEKDLKEWIQKEGTCPLTRKPMTIEDILPASKQYEDMLETIQNPDNLIKYSFNITKLHFDLNNKEIIFFNCKTKKHIKLNVNLITSWRITKYASGKIATLQINFQNHGHTKYICLSNSTINIELDKIFMYLIPDTKTSHLTSSSLISSLISNEITSASSKKNCNKNNQFDI